MLRTTYGARRCNERITLTQSRTTTDDYGHAAVGEAAPVLEVYAEVRQMSATKTMLTFQQADVVGVDLYFRKPSVPFDGALWRGHAIHFPQPEEEDMRGMYVKVSGFYQQDNPGYNG